MMMDIKAMIRAAIDSRNAEKAAEAQAEWEQRTQEEQAKIELHERTLARLAPVRSVVEETMLAFSDMLEFRALFCASQATEVVKAYDDSMNSDFSMSFMSSGLGSVVIYSGAWPGNEKFSYNINLSVLPLDTRTVVLSGNGETDAIVARLEFQELGDYSSGIWDHIPEETVFLDTSSPEQLQKTLIDAVSDFLVRNNINIPSI